MLTIVTPSSIIRQEPSTTERAGKRVQQKPASAALLALRADANTYTEGVSPAEQAQFEAFSAGLDLVSDEQQDEMDELLEGDEAMGALYQKLVPKVRVVSSLVFMQSSQCEHSAGFAYVSSNSLRCTWSM
jgi:hypothetical protein